MAESAVKRTLDFGASQQLPFDPMTGGSEEEMRAHQEEILRKSMLADKEAAADLAAKEAAMRTALEEEAKQREEETRLM